MGKPTSSRPIWVKRFSATASMPKWRNIGPWTMAVFRRIWPWCRCGRMPNCVIHWPVTSPTTSPRCSDWPQLQQRLPDLASLSEQAFVKILARLRDFPTVWTHGDFHPYNVCAGGVIDLETTQPGIAGYDIINRHLDGRSVSARPYDLSLHIFAESTLFFRGRSALCQFRLASPFGSCSRLRTVQNAPDCGNGRAVATGEAAVGIYGAIAQW